MFIFCITTIQIEIAGWPLMTPVPIPVPSTAKLRGDDDESSLHASELKTPICSSSGDYESRVEYMKAITSSSIKNAVFSKTRARLISSSDATHRRHNAWGSVE